jgi:hypothetical protein
MGDPHRPAVVGLLRYRQHQRQWACLDGLGRIEQIDPGRALWDMAVGDAIISIPMPSGAVATSVGIDEETRTIWISPCAVSCEG